MWYTLATRRSVLTCHAWELNPPAVSNNPIQLLDSMNKVCEMIENGELPDNIDDIAEALEEKKIRDKYIFPQILSD